MGTTNYPSGYLIRNTQRTKKLNVVVQFSGIPTLFSLVPIYEKIRYGDPRIHYGDPGIVYGGLIKKDGVESILQVTSGLNISQVIEPEQGRGSVSTLSLSFIDKDQIMTKLISPGVLVPEPLVNVLVTVSLGFADSAFPGDYYKIFRGYVTKTTSKCGIVSIELSDANVKRRQTIFMGGTSSLTAPVNNTQTNIPINNTADFIKQILGPGGTYDSAVTTYIKVENEFMTYDPTGIVSSTQINVLSRGGSNSRGTSAANHPSGAAVSNNVQFQGNVIDLGLKIMMSGWNGPWLTGVPVTALGTSLDPFNVQNAAILLPAGFDAVSDFGLTLGDFITISGSTVGNNGQYFITAIDDALGDRNRMIIVDRNLTLENPANMVALAFRSQYDTFPVSCGLRNTPQDVDVGTHQEIRSLLFSSGIYTNQVFIGDTQAGQTGKDLIEGTLWLPAGLYTITRYGQISVAVTLPPIAQQGMIFLDADNVIMPQNITVTRAANNRRFYNVIVFNFDLRDDGSYGTQSIFLDQTSPNPIDIEQILPINADGIKSSLGGAVAAQQRGLFILNRYKKAAYEITLSVNWTAAALIEVGDIVAVVDNGQLQITNFETGERNLGTALLEVIQRSLNIKEGTAELTLLSNVGYKAGQRFGTISPSSRVAPGSTNNSIEIKDSYGPLYPGNEKKKWERLNGLPIIVHDELWTQSATAILDGFSPVDPYRMMVSPSLPFVPPVDYVVDIVNYDIHNSNPKYIELYKTLFAFIDPTFTVTAPSGSSQTQFQVSPSDAALLNVGQPILVHDQLYTNLSPESTIQSINPVSGLITVKTPLGFVPSSGMSVELGGFIDGGGSYRIL